MALRVLFADDDDIIRHAIGKSLEAHPQIDLVAAVEDGVRALDALVSESVDIALLDVRMPRLDGIATAEHIHADYPGVTVVMFTTFEQKSALGRALAAGAKGFLTKDIPIDELVDALYRAQAGENVMSAKPTTVLVDSMRNIARNWQRDQEFLDTVESLPSHLVAILDRLVVAKSYREIANDLEITENTVRSYATKIYAVTQCRNRGALTVRAMQAGYQPASEALA